VTGRGVLAIGAGLLTTGPGALSPVVWTLGAFTLVLAAVDATCQRPGALGTAPTDSMPNRCDANLSAQLEHLKPIDRVSGHLGGFEWGWPEELDAGGVGVR
jgi:hypothetical protein